MKSDEGMMDDAHDMVPPLFLVEGDDVLMFPDDVSLKRYVESPDAECYAGFDSMGRMFRMYAAVSPREGFIQDVTACEIHDTHTAEPELLRMKLLAFLAVAGLGTAGAVTLEDAVAEFRAKVGFTC